MIAGVVTGSGGRPGGFTVLKGAYRDKIARLYSDGSRPAAEQGATLRAALAAIPAGWKVELDGLWMIDRDGANPWCLRLPDKSLHSSAWGRRRRSGTTTPPAAPTRWCWSRACSPAPGGW
jgi:hypothetical protein